MILYHCATMYQVLEAIVHHERVHGEEHCVLLLADFSAKKYQDYRELEAFFDEVLLFPYRSISNDPDTILKTGPAIPCRTWSLRYCSFRSFRRTESCRIWRGESFGSVF